MSGVEELVSGVVAREKGAVARALNLVDDRRAEARAGVARLLGALAGESSGLGGHRIGITGPPGVGKSTLAAALARELRARGRTVAVVAVDPSSVRSGGALLGDRARMSFDPTDDGVFVRSLATSGEPGGLAWAANASVRVLAAGFEVVLVETTGVGQTETDVVHVADTVVLVVQPGSGDTLQFLKAGIMEVPDVVVVNKADQGETAVRTATDLRGALHALRAAGVDAAEGPVLTTSARDGTGIGELLDAIDVHRARLGETGVRARRRAGSIAWATSLFRRRFGEHGVERVGGADELARRVATAIDARVSPLEVVESLGGGA